MAWCLTAPSHYLNQCWLIISRKSGGQGVWKSSALRWSRNFEMNEWMKKTFWASNFVLKPKIFFGCPAGGTHCICSRYQSLEYVAKLHINLTYRLLGNVAVISKLIFILNIRFDVSNDSCKIVIKCWMQQNSTDDKSIFVSGNSLVQSGNITRANVDQDRWHHMVSRGHNGLKLLSYLSGDKELNYQVLDLYSIWVIITPVHSYPSKWPQQENWKKLKIFKSFFVNCSAAADEKF